MNHRHEAKSKVRYKQDTGQKGGHHMMFLLFNIPRQGNTKQHEQKGGN